MLPVLTADAVEQDVIVSEDPVIGKHAEQFRAARDFHAAFFFQLSAQRQLSGLTPLDSAARQEQPLGISVAHQQNLTVRVLNDAPHPERHRSGQAKPGPKQLGSQVKQDATPRFQFQGSPNR